MPIPAFQSGVLPPGIHDATLDEIEEALGRLWPQHHRRTLMLRLREFVADLRRWNMADELLVDGSFVTDKPEPNDIDLLLVLRSDYDLGRAVSPFEYNLRSHRMVKRKFGFDLYATDANSPDYDKFVRLFSRVRGQPEMEKGMIRVRL